MSNSKNNLPPTWTTGWTDVFETGTWRSAKPSYQERTAPCKSACPLNGEITSWTENVFRGEWEQAWLTISNNNPFPAICGRICHHPCESKCNREAYDGAVTVNALEQFIGDMALEQGWPLSASLPEVQNQKIAVIGGGPAGLACAYKLRQQGYPVTIFEAQPELGGVLRYGIPGYRLSKSIVQGEINRLLALGFEVRTNTTVSATQLADLKEQFAAIFWATGAPVPKTLPHLPVDNAQVLDSLSFLQQVNRGEGPVLGGQVVIVGGGSVALDAARTARRLGNQVKVLALEARSCLPAQPGEVLEAEAEGVVILPGTMVREVKNSGKSLILDCVANTDFILLADTVIVAVGQEAELGEVPAQIAVKNALIVVQKDQATSLAGLYAGGDVASSVRYVSEAIADGMRAASGIVSYLHSEGHGPVIDQDDPVSFDEINTFYFPSEARQERELVEVAERLTSFDEERCGLSDQQAIAQAKRCFNCGRCLRCNNCYYFCPDTAVVKNDAPTEPYYIADQYCKGCGLCVEECPRGAIRLEEEEGR